MRSFHFNGQYYVIIVRIGSSMQIETKLIITVIVGAAIFFAAQSLLHRLLKIVGQKWLKGDDEDDSLTMPAKKEGEAAPAEPLKTAVEREATESDAQQDMDKRTRLRRMNHQQKHDRAKKARLTMSYEFARRAEVAYQEGVGLVEAYFFAQLALLNGHRQIKPLCAQIRMSWRQVGYPSEKHLTHGDFGMIESALGRACLRIDTKHDAEIGEASLRELSEKGVDLAKDFLKDRGL